MTLNAYEFKVAAVMANHMGMVPVGWTPAQFVKHLCNIDAKAREAGYGFLAPNVIPEGALPPEPSPEPQLLLQLAD